MAITLRVDKGSALTLNQLDTNFTEFFYSSSISADQKTLTLHYTGSDSGSFGVAQGRNHTIPLNPYTGSASQAVGSAGHIQFSNGSGFASDANIAWDDTNNVLRVNQPTILSGDGIAVRNAHVRLKSTNSPNEDNWLIFHGNGANKSGSIRYNFDEDYNFSFHSSTTLTDTGRNGFKFIVDRLSTEPFVHFAGNDHAIALGYANTGVATVNISGSLSIQGNGTNVGRIGKLHSFENEDRIDKNTGTNILPGNSRGLILEGPHTGHVVVGLHGSGSNQGFAIISAPVTASSHVPTYDKLVAFFAGDGKVGIGTKTPSQNLHVEGSMLVTGNTVLGNATSDDTQITGDLDVDVNLNVDGAAVIDGEVTLHTLPTASASDFQYIVRNSSNKIAQQNIAAPIPVGGIIMWSGNMNAIPSGFAICDGAVHNSVQTPDLRNKFIVGANNTGSAAAPTTTVSGSATASGGSATHNHGGNVGNTTLNNTQIPSHNHTYKDSYFIEIHNVGVGASGAIAGVDHVGPTKYKGSGDSDNDNEYVYYRNGTTNTTGGGGSHTHTISTQTNVPPFFALAYIMFVGT